MGRHKDDRSPLERIMARSEPDGECVAWLGATDGKGYGMLFLDGRPHRVHRLVWAALRGPIPEGMVIDHLCHRRNCVRVEHLRLATVAENSRHRRGASALSTTGHRNVYWSKRRKKFQVAVGFEGRSYGHYHECLEDAIEEAGQIRAELFGDFAGGAAVTDPHVQEAASP